MSEKEIQIDPEVDVAIVGISGRFPGGADVNGFWDTLLKGRSGVVDVPLADAEARYPQSASFDNAEAIPDVVIRGASEIGLWGAAVTQAYGGLGYDNVEIGLVAEELGRGSASLLSLFTVHSMVCVVLERWGRTEQKEKWLPKLARGEMLAAFALPQKVHRLLLRDFIEQNPRL